MDHDGLDANNECEQLSFEKSEFNEPRARHDSGMKLLDPRCGSRNRKSNTSKANSGRSKEFSSANRFDVPFNNEEHQSRALLSRGGLYGASELGMPTSGMEIQQ